MSQLTNGTLPPSLAALTVGVLPTPFSIHRYDSCCILGGRTVVVPVRCVSGGASEAKFPVENLETGR